MADKDLEFYKKNQSLFLADFFHDGNSNLKVSIESRRDVESGLWFTATWQSYPDLPMEVSAQTMKLMWERVMKAYLQDERERDRLTELARPVVQQIIERARQ